MTYHVQQDDCLVDRRTGGLEKVSRSPRAQAGVDRRTGGLEIMFFQMSGQI